MNNEAYREFCLHTRKKVLSDIHRLRKEPDYREMNFLDLVRFAEKNYCMKYYCPVCRNMQFRTLVKELGEKRIADMINSVTCQQLENAWDIDWKMAMEITIRLFKENSLDFEWVSIRESALYQEYEFLDLSIYDLVEKRVKEEKQKIKSRIKQEQTKHRSEYEAEVAEARRIVMKWIRKEPLEEQLRTIVSGRKPPSYYGIDFTAIYENDLRNIPKPLLIDVVTFFRNIKDPEWRALQQKAESVLST